MIPRTHRWYATGGALLGCLALMTAAWPAASHPAIRQQASIVTTQSGSQPGATQRQPEPATRPAIAPPTPGYRLDAPPSISAAHIDAILASYNSPAAGQGTVFYDFGLQYRIDPAYALAFYVQESSAGTKGVARSTHSIGNIRCTPGYRCLEGYRAYDTYQQAIEDWYKLIRTLYIDEWNLRTPSAILPRYAPWGDNNNPDLYASTVQNLVQQWAGQ